MEQGAAKCNCGSYREVLSQEGGSSNWQHGEQRQSQKYTRRMDLILLVNRMSHLSEEVSHSYHLKHSIGDVPNPHRVRRRGPVPKRLVATYLKSLARRQEQASSTSGFERRSKELLALCCTVPLFILCRSRE